MAAARSLSGLISADPAAILPFTRSLAMQMLGAVVAILAIIAAADYLFQYRQWYERQKMSLQEMKEEFRQTEGDPAVKGKLRQLRQARTRKRMMAAVPKASVVITNPTHFAVALQYERGMNAPVCVAKGVDLIARKIREVAEAHDIPVVENPPLGPRAARHRRDRPGNSAGTLPRGRRNHRLHHAAARDGGGLRRCERSRNLLRAHAHRARHEMLRPFPRRREIGFGVRRFVPRARDERAPGGAMGPR